MSQQEIADKLQNYLTGGGTAVVTATQIAALPPSSLGITANLKNCSDFVS
jgi:hypothetical protein